jgi:Ca2+-dependent lipid-binding protein
MSRFISKGQRLERKTMIGKSRRKWLSICINEAVLTKDLETFSKMDPYCKFGPVDQKQGWRNTSVQDNIGLHPIWNESFFIELLEGQGQ